jgi:hypothetical protein
MNDIAYFAWQGLKLDEAMRAHETKTGRKTSQIVCRKADLPEVAKQLRPEHVELRADSYVQRGTLYLATVVLVLVMLAFQPAAALAAPAADATVTTTVSRVFPFTRNGADYCNIGLANMKTLTNVFGPECQARRGQRVTLHYVDHVEETVVCNLRGCKTATKTARTLLSWYIDL